MKGMRSAPASHDAVQAHRAADAIVFDRVSLAFDDHEVLRDLSFTIPRGAMRILFGASGAGKSQILKLALGLLKPDSGTIHVNGLRVDQMSEHDLLRMRSDIGMVFQENALFDSLTVAENVGFRLYEEHDLTDADIDRRVAEVLGFVGLAEFGDRMPSALSGGQRRRVGIARAMASKPHLLLFDDPITGLDPLIATSIDDEIVKLRDLEDVTTLVVTHQIRDAFYIAEHRAERRGDAIEVIKTDPSNVPNVEFLVLLDGTIRFQGSASELLASKDPYLTEYLYKTLPPW